jgi:hypothetical protein
VVHLVDVVKPPLDVDHGSTRFLKNLRMLQLLELRILRHFSKTLANEDFGVGTTLGWSLGGGSLLGYVLFKGGHVIQIPDKLYTL